MPTYRFKLAQKMRLRLTWGAPRRADLRAVCDGIFLPVHDDPVAQALRISLPTGQAVLVPYEGPLDAILLDGAPIPGSAKLERARTQAAAMAPYMMGMAGIQLAMGSAMAWLGGDAALAFGLAGFTLSLSAEVRWRSPSTSFAHALGCTVMAYANTLGGGPMQSAFSLIFLGLAAVAFGTGLVRLGWAREEGPPVVTTRAIGSPSGEPVPMAVALPPARVSSAG